MDSTTIITAIVGLIGAVVTGFISYKGGQEDTRQNRHKSELEAGALSRDKLQERVYELETKVETLLEANHVLDKQLTLAHVQLELIRSRDLFTKDGGVPDITQFTSPEHWSRAGTLEIPRVDFLAEESDED